MGILVTVEKANHQSLMKDGQSPLANRTISCQLSHQELPTTKSFLYHQTVQFEQSEVRLPVTECGKRCRVIDCEMCLFGQTNLRKAWWTETQNHVELIEEILQGHLLRSHYPPTEKEEHTIYSRIFPKDPHCEFCRRTKITRAHCRRNSENESGHFARQNLVKMDRRSQNPQ